MSAQGMPLASATSYVFNTGCSTDDDFSNNATPIGNACWTIVPSTVGAVIPTISSGELGFTFGSAYAFPGYSTATPAVYKTFANIPADFTATVQVTNSGPAASGCALWIARTSASIMSENAFVTIRGDGSGVAGAYVGTVNLDAPFTPAASYICLRVNLDGSVTYGNGPTADTCDPVTTNTYAPGTTIPSSGPAVIFLSSLNQNASSTTCTFSNFTVTGASATGQD